MAIFRSKKNDFSFPILPRVAALLFAALAWGFISSTSTVADPERATTWTRWEKVLSSHTTYPNPYSDVTVSVVYTGPGGEQITGYGFWDGGTTFRLRAMFPVPGTWSWRTTSSDTANGGLHDLSGTVTVTPSSGTNPLYQKGYLKISLDQRYLTYADGTPFLWLGDTAWAGPIVASQSEWQAYIQKRQSQRFTVIQASAGAGFLNRTTDRAGNAPFTGSSANLQLNPAYWREVERKVQYANDQGLIVFFTSVREPARGFPRNDAVQVRRFAQHFAARMMGNFVVFAPYNDYWEEPGDDQAGDELHKSTSVHLVTQHPEFTWEPHLVFRSKPWTDFAGMQTGGGWVYNPHVGESKKPHDPSQASKQVIEFPLNLHSQSPVKPLLNLEGVYDARGIHEGDTTRVLQPFPTRLPRSSAYLSMLSGATGYTYGVWGVWNWGINPGWGGPIWDFNTALNRPSGTEMQYWFELFSGLEWWKLVPNPSLIQNQTDEWLTKMAISTSPDGTLGIAYLPDNASIVLNLDSFAGPVIPRWFNPVTNVSVTESAVVPNAGNQTFIKPSGWGDAVLVLTLASSTAAVAPPNTLQQR